MKALFASAVINGILVVPILGGTAHRRCNGKAMGEFLPGRGLLALGWTTVAVMALTVLGLGATWLR